MTIKPAQIKYVDNRKDNPNKKVMSFILEGNHLGPFSQLVFTAPRLIQDNSSPTPLSYSPLVERLFEHLKTTDINRIDLSQKDGGTLISFSRATPLWMDEHITKLKIAIWDYMNKSNPVLLHEALKNNIEHFSAIVSKPLTPKKDTLEELLKNSFDKHVTPVLKMDGGSMQLLSIDIANDGKITTEVALMGSCNGCTGAQTRTLNGAAQEVSAVLAENKKMNPENKDLQRLEFQPIQTKNFMNMIIL